MPTDAQLQAIVALGALGQSSAQIAASVGVEIGDVVSVLGAGVYAAVPS